MTKGIIEAFKENDKNKDGKITKEEMKQIMEENGHEWGELEEAQFQLMDVDQGGSISLQGTLHSDAKVSMAPKN